MLRAKPLTRATVEEEGEDVEIDEDGAEAELTIGVSEIDPTLT